MPTGSALKSERPCWGEGGVGGGQGGRGGAQHGLLSGHVWDSWLWPKPSIHCVRKAEERKREHNTLTVGETNKDQRHASHMWTQNLL